MKERAFRWWSSLGSSVVPRPPARRRPARRRSTSTFFQQKFFCLFLNFNIKNISLNILGTCRNDSNNHHGRRTLLLRSSVSSTSVGPLLVVTVLPAATRPSRRPPPPNKQQGEINNPTGPLHIGRPESASAAVEGCLEFTLLLPPTPILRTHAHGWVLVRKEQLRQ